MRLLGQRITPFPERYPIKIKKPKTVKVIFVNGVEIIPSRKTHKKIPSNDISCHKSSMENSCNDKLQNILREFKKISITQNSSETENQEQNIIEV